MISEITNADGRHFEGTLIFSLHNQVHPSEGLDPPSLPLNFPTEFEIGNPAKEIQIQVAPGTQIMNQADRE